MVQKYLKGCKMDRAASFESLESKIKEGSVIKSAEETPKLSSKSLLNLTDSNGNNSRRSLSQGSVSYERLRSLKQMVDRAIKVTLFSIRYSCKLSICCIYLRYIIIYFKYLIWKFEL